MHNWDNPSTWVILLVDDEVDNLEVVAETLAFYGSKVRTATSGTDALNLLAAFSPTLVVTDLSMPGIDGWQLRRKIKELPATQDVPIVALSAHAMVGDKERALNAGFDGYITKPISVPTLLDELKSVVKHEMLSKSMTRSVPAPVTVLPGTPVPPVEAVDMPVPPAKTVDAPVPPAEVVDMPVPPANTADTPIPPAKTIDAPVLPAEVVDTPAPPANTVDTPIPPAKTIDAPVPPADTLSPFTLSANTVDTPARPVDRTSQTVIVAQKEDIQP